MNTLNNSSAQSFLFTGKLAVVLALGILGSASVFVACSRDLPSSKSALRVQLPYEPISLDPSLAEDGVSLQVLNNIWDGLVGYDARGQLQNRLAESYQVSQDGKK